MTIILKATLVWGSLLILYFLLLSKERAARWNRMYLWLSLTLGIVIPFTENPFPTQQMTKQATATAVPRPAADVWAMPTGNIPVAGSGDEMNWPVVLFYVWLAGATLQLCFLVRNAFQLYFLRKNSGLNRHPVADYYTNENTSSAFSFGSSIFLPEAGYQPGDLALVLQHEKGHYRHRHWIDNLVLELLQVGLWGHPLFFVFKNQIKLVHEYEVDADIGEDDRYDYGKLLLAQSNKTYRTVLVHTFNFSPLKKRIAMMTNTKKANKWKFLWALPLMGICFGLMSAERLPDERAKNGNITKFRGNTIEWSEAKEIEISVVDPISGEEMIQTVAENERIIKCNDREVFNGININNYPDPENYYINNAVGAIAQNISTAIEQQKSKFPKDLAHMNIFNIVVDRDFKVIYFDVQLMGNDRRDTSVYGINKPLAVWETLDKILSNDQLVNPEKLRSDREYYDFRTQARLGITKFRFEPVTSK